MATSTDVREYKFRGEYVETDYDTWYKRVNATCMKVCGLGIDDLADHPSWDAWDSGTSPRDYVVEVLEDEGFPFDE